MSRQELEVLEAGADGVHQAQFYQEYRPKHKIRIVTATSLFDGHDASINIMRRLLQARGAEIIHLGHNRAAREVVQAAIQEDVQAIALSSYQGGHMEYFKYIRELLDECGASQIRIFGGGGGVIVPSEIEELHESGITRIYSPEDGQNWGLNGIIGHMLSESDFSYTEQVTDASSQEMKVSRSLSLLEDRLTSVEDLIATVKEKQRFKKIPVLGITGTGGAGKSSLTDELISRFLWDFPEIRIGVLCVDPSKRKTGGALLGDRIRMNSISDDRVFVRSFATRGSGSELAKVTADAVAVMRSQDYDFIIVETSGIGQGDAQILELSDISLYVMTAEYGAATQLEKIDMLDYADLVAINKYERRQAPDALRDVRTLMRRNRFQGLRMKDHDYPVFGTIASRFSDDGVNGLYRAVVSKINESCDKPRYKVNPDREYSLESSNRSALITDDRANYLSDVVRSVRRYHQWAENQVKLVKKSESFFRAANDSDSLDAAAKKKLDAEADNLWRQVDERLRKSLDEWNDVKNRYSSDEFIYQVRGNDVRVDASTTSLSGLKIPKISLPPYEAKSEVARFILKEGYPGSFPYTGGVFPFRRQGEDPVRMFAGEGGPSRTNTRFKYLSKDSDAKRLSTAFDSVTLYGADPDLRPDIYGKVGNSGVSIATLEDMKTLYSGFDLCSPTTSVSMTINGPAPIILAFFLNAAIDQQVDKFSHEHGRIPKPAEHDKIVVETLMKVRGTVQADILKEDQAQNTCIFSTEFALKMMADVQEFFIEKQVKNYYSVSISGYHIAEAGANPVTQLAFTLANGFTYVEYYLARGMKVDDFAANLSFFFSNGVDPEYSVLGRVARRIWAIAMRDIYGASEKSQKLKYHIQTSGRSLHAQEIDFNDIRTTLQALLALYDNCNSLHTNAYDEAITTPTEESVRRALAIQMIINKEFGPNKCENINQGSYFLGQLTDLVEQAVLSEFERISSRGGVLGAMETQYQRSKIQEESLYYESLKDTGELPIIGVNTFLNPNPDQHSSGDIELMRSSDDEKDDQLKRLQTFWSDHQTESQKALKKLAKTVMGGGNVFAELMHTVRHASLGQITETLYRVGGQYRRTM